MMSSALFLHPGYPKTATTSLQNGVFDQHPRIDYIGRKYNSDARDTSLHTLIWRAGNESDACFRKNLPHYRGVVSRMLESAQKDTCVLSDEDALAYYPLGTFLPVDVRKRAERLYLITTDAAKHYDIKIIVTIRNQLEIITSWFTQIYHLIARKTSIRTLDALIRAEIERKDPTLLSSFRYDDVIATYTHLFGTNNITILVYEELKHAPEVFIRNLARILRIDQTTALQVFNTSVTDTKRKIKKGGRYKKQSYFEFLLRRFKNSYIPFIHLHSCLPGRLLVQLIQRIPGTGSEYIYMSEQTREKLTRYYASQNTRLQEHFGLSLSQYGYPLHE
jgi:hypothetical protein